jgi:anthranilate/para-aminobenzoate synthase component II
MSMKVLMVDNYDSFTYNLVQYLGELGAEIDVVRNDVAAVEELLERAPDRVVVSPGPCGASRRPGSRRSASAWATSRWRRPSAAA